MQMQQGFSQHTDRSLHRHKRLAFVCMGERDPQIESKRLSSMPLDARYDKDGPRLAVEPWSHKREQWLQDDRPAQRTLDPADLTPPTPAAVMNEEQRITACKTGLERIYTMLRSSPQDWRNFIALGRSIVGHIDATTFMQKASRTTEQAWMIAGLQRLASIDVESGGILDISAWCSRQWLVILQREQTNVAALRGIGQAWLSRAQPTLVRIQRTDSSSSSGGSQRSGSQRSPSSKSSKSSAEQERQKVAEAERKAGTADYVEARGFLQPATEYLDRAVAAASSQRILSGDLLSATAEAYMSLGNTSSPRVNERLFRRALQLLRAASQIRGYALSRYLQQYLDDYGKLLD